MDGCELAVILWTMRYVLLQDGTYLSFFLSIDTESIKFRSSSQVWWVAKF